tara:strand:- start:475 stop:585 length:111 start_codon:yes stop_codon:yes gene_type:complete
MKSLAKIKAREASRKIALKKNLRKRKNFKEKNKNIK